MRRVKLLFKCVCCCFLLLLFNTGCRQKNTQELLFISSENIAKGTAPILDTAQRNVIVKNNHFYDQTGRSLFLRGINLGGDSKVPYSPNGATHIKEGFFNGAEVSFIGRPFPLVEADQHFSRLKSWGFHFFRFLVTWEALEHEGPGIYDTNYIAYVRAIIKKADEYGLNVLIDPHQDVWSRFSGGDGAPMWLFDSINMDVTKLQETGAAFVHNVYGDPFPRMIWYTNNFKLATATMFTLFFGGNDFAPMTKIDGIPVQEYFQQHYIYSMLELARGLQGLPNIIGFELMNEPSSGYIGIEDLTRRYHTDIVGDAPTPEQSILAGNGIPQTIATYRVGAVSLKHNGDKILNPDGISVWKNNEPGIWIKNGVMEKTDTCSYRLKNPAYFSEIDGKKINFNERHYAPFAKKYAKAIQSIDSSWVICVDDILFPYPMELPDLKEIPGFKWMNGSHWYDDVTLVKKHYLPFLGFYKGELVFGKKKVQKAYERTHADMIEATQQHFGNVPSLLGEFGIPFDMNNRKAYHTGDFKTQTKALDRSIRIAEKNLLSYTLWNYTASNTNERGDLWNGEDLSIFSLTQQSDTSDINSGGRALDAAIRPYPKKIAGTLITYDYDYRTRTLKIVFNAEYISEYPTEVFLPEYVYGNGFNVSYSTGQLSFDEREHTLLYTSNEIGEHIIIVELD